MNFAEYLENDVMPFWLKTSIDEENGGIFTSLGRDGEIYGTDKSVWFQGRALYILSVLHNMGYKAHDYLSAAEKIFKFIPKCEDTDGRMYFTVTAEGKGLQKRRYYFSETFAAIGCCEYYIATKNEKAKVLAEKYFQTAYSIFRDPSLTVPKINPENAPSKALSPVMIMLSTAQVMRKINFEKYNPLAKEMTDEILHGGYLNEEAGALLESVRPDGSFINSPSGRVVNPGHSLEAAWFLMSEGVYSGNEEAISAGKKIIDITMPKGIDAAHGGVIAFRDALGFPPIQLEWDMKLWWPQCEGIIANLLAYNLFGEEKYNENFKTLLDYAMKNFADRENGEWYGYLHYDNTPANYLKGNIFKGPFHLPRMLMICELLSAEKSIKEFLK